MARVNKGKSLNGPVLQPGWTIEDDGFGLLTCSATFKVAHGNSTGTPGTGAQALGKAPKRGDAFEQDGRLTCHRSSSVMDANGIQIISADYVGIAQGTMTSPNVSGRFSSNQEPIATHPKFQVQIGGTKDFPQNGAVFNDDGSFKRFADPAFDRFYGVTSYLACGFGISGYFYTSQTSMLSSLMGAVGSTSGTGYWASVNLMGQLGTTQGSASGLSGNNYVGPGNPTTIAGPIEDEAPTYLEVDNNQLLLSGLGVEYFGNLMKISYDIMFSQDGWNGSIYNDRTSSAPAKSTKATSWKGSNTPKSLGGSWKGSSTPKTL